MNITEEKLLEYLSKALVCVAVNCYRIYNYQVDYRDSPKNP